MGGSVAVAYCGRDYPRLVIRKPTGRWMSRCPYSPSAPEVRLGNDQVVVADLHDDLDSRILVAGHHDEPVGGLHGTLVLAERDLDRPPALRRVTLAHERHRLVAGGPSGLLHISAPRVVGLERLLVLRRALEAGSPVGSRGANASK